MINLLKDITHFFMARILIAGGTGFVGQQLAVFLRQQNHQCVVLTRDQKQVDFQKYFYWDVAAQYIDPKALEGVEVIINMTGANIGAKKWSPARKKALLTSRIEPLALIYKLLSEHEHQVKHIISSSAVGYYGMVTNDHIYKEHDQPGTDFLAEICTAWEDKALQFGHLQLPTTILRKGVVLGKDGGMLTRLKPLAAIGLSTAIGSGKQYLPWIAIEDLCRMYDFIITKKVYGIYNAVSSDMITMNDFAHAMANTQAMPKWSPNAPAFLIKAMLGDMAQMLLEGSRVSNDKIKRAGFKPKHDEIGPYLKSLRLD